MEFTDYKYSDNFPYKQIVIYEHQPQGLISRVQTQNDDGTYFIDFTSNPQPNNKFITREVSKFRKNKTKIYTEDYYEVNSYCEKIYKSVIIWGQNGIAEKTLYYDKEGNEIPESEINFPKTQ